MKLAVADVDRDDSGSSRLQETFRESTRRRAHISAVAPGDVEAERLQRVLQLLASARHEARRALHLELSVFSDLLARLVVPRDETREHERLRLRTRLGESALHEKHVQALLDHTSDGSVTRRRGARR